MHIARKKYQQGFTLIEIIIVVVILGILAAIALPKLAANTDKVRAAECFTYLASISRAFSRCLDEVTVGARIPTAADVAACDTFAEMDPTGALVAAPAGADWQYTPGAAGTQLVIISNYFGPNPSPGLITYTIEATTGAVTTDCNGKWQRMC